MSRKALMLIREDKELLRICEAMHALIKEREDTHTGWKEEHDEYEAEWKERATASDREATHRIKEMGLLSLDKDHEISIDPLEGVVWLVAKRQDCDCPLCQLRVAIVGRR